MTREQIRDTIFDKITDWTPYADAYDERVAQSRGGGPYATDLQRVIDAFGPLTVVWQP